MQQRIRTGVSCLALVACTAVAWAGTHAEKPAADNATAQMSPEMQAEMAAWMEMGKPGQEHQQLAASAGTWKAKGKSYMGPQPTPWEGTSQRQMILGGRVMAETFKADMMGMAMEGHAMVGYDNAKKQWWTTWNDNMSTGVLMATGNWDDAVKGVVFNGAMTGPKGETIKVRMITRHPSATEEQFEYWEERGGQMMKTMEMTLTKQ
jgi:hypothetical protein